jgi:hypothetical protein
MKQIINFQTEVCKALFMAIPKKCIYRFFTVISEALRIEVVDQLLRLQIISQKAPTGPSLRNARTATVGPYRLMLHQAHFGTKGGNRTFAAVCANVC